MKNFVKIAFVTFVIVLNQFASAAPKIEHWVTDSGLRVYYVNVPELPILDARLTFAAGSAYDGGKAGLSGMTSGMFDKGAAGLNADQIAEAFESVGANFSAGAARDMAWISLRTLTLEEQMTSALEIWQKVIEKPDFPDADFERLKKQALVGLQAEKQNPSSIANKAFYKNLYGDHPYASPQNGTEKSITALTTKDLKAFFKQYYVNKNGQLALVGDIDKQQAIVIADKISKALLSGVAGQDRGEGEKAAAIPEVKA
ncbi:MAG: insulinase family protein, partial [Thiotrichaceae bacterium]|nr:insulinase family protein [Thiotrichaceae bacterium]